MSTSSISGTEDDDDRKDQERIAKAFEVLCTIGTSNQWSILTAIHTKLNKKLLNKGLSITEEELRECLAAKTSDELKELGIWVEFDNIICINAVFGRKRAAEGGLILECSCDGGQERSSSKYFGSHDYNGGRHACTASTHKGACAFWEPPSTGHLHSWRRGFTDNEKKKKKKKKKSSEE
eukprot:TRINITY_DN4320_c5_g1_i1.p1 TRINITY_DN4320_c5_g1~~TRINITY_DN4320_c5_g1_i1.p1  ORF type:complete len:179 (-),score=62.18 TRINITY_DN4320_c5_g1_i1:79-615(-)